MSNLVTVILTIRVIGANPEGGSVYYMRTVNVPEVPRVGDFIYINPEETESCEVTRRDWGYDGTPTVRLSTISAVEDARKTFDVETLVRDGWKLDPVQDKR